MRSEIFYKKYVIDCMYSPFTKITYILSYTHTPHQISLEQFLRAICGAVFWAAVLTLPQILNLQLSHYALFLFSVDTTITSNLTLGGFKQHTFITRGSGDYEVQDQSAGRSDLMSGEDPNPGLQTPIFSCCPQCAQQREQACTSFLTRTIIPFMRAPSP